MQKIGIAITTTSNRPEHLELCLMQIELYTKEEKQLFIAKDIPNIAKAKNECLKALKDCDYIFMFDDDCFPIKDGWVDFFINSGQEHLLYLIDRHHKFGEINGVGLYKDCGGCFMFLTKKAFERVGYFNTEYKMYGFEHAGYSMRINKDFMCLEGTKDYIYSLDYQGEGKWGIKHHSSIKDLDAQSLSIAYNRAVFQKEITSDKIYYEP